MSNCKLNIYIYVYLYIATCGLGKKKVLPSITAYVSIMWRRGRDDAGLMFCRPRMGSGMCVPPFTSHRRATYTTLALYCPQHTTGQGGLLRHPPHPNPWLLRESFRIAGRPNSSFRYRFCVEV